MPKIGMEPLRRKALVDAALRTIGHHGSLNVTMSDIAREAGVSAALAHHYFGSKQQLLLETIRSLLRDLRRDAVAALTRANGPRARLSAIVHVSFQSDQFTPETVSAWLAFYVEAQRSEETRRLLVLYSRRLRSNLMASLNRLCPMPRALRKGRRPLSTGFISGTACVRRPSVSLQRRRLSRIISTCSSNLFPMDSARSRPSVFSKEYST